jgi:hypothetical protein
MQERFTVRWANGYWRVFDTEQYTTVELRYTERDAQFACEQANAEWAQRGAQR